MDQCGHASFEGFFESLWVTEHIFSLFPSHGDNFATTASLYLLPKFIAFQGCLMASYFP